MSETTFVLETAPEIMTDLIGGLIFAGYSVSVRSGRLDGWDGRLAVEITAEAPEGAEDQQGIAAVWVRKGKKWSMVSHASGLADGFGSCSGVVPKTAVQLITHAGRNTAEWAFSELAPQPAPAQEETESPSDTGAEEQLALTSGQDSEELSEEIIAA